MLKGSPPVAAHPRRPMRAMLEILKAALASWRRDRAPRLGAALAYYTVFSIPPLLIFLIGMAGVVFGREAVQGRVVTTLRELLGPHGAQAVEETLRSVSTHDRGVAATGIGIATLLLGASGVFGQLKDALNTVWEVQRKPASGLWGMIRDNVWSVVTVIGTGFLLIVSLALNAAVAALGDYLRLYLPGSESVWTVLNAAMALASITVVFALIYKVVPDARIPWRHAFAGGVMTALLFTVGEQVIGLYLGHTNVGSVFGAAGSLIVVLVWIYYSAQIFLFGSELTKAITTRAGRRRVAPEAHAEPATPEARAEQGLDRAPTAVPHPRPAHRRA